MIMTTFTESLPRPFCWKAQTMVAGQSYLVHDWIMNPLNSLNFIVEAFWTFKSGQVFFEAGACLRRDCLSACQICFVPCQCFILLKFRVACSNAFFKLIQNLDLSILFNFSASIVCLAGWKRRRKAGKPWTEAGFAWEFQEVVAL